MKIEIKIILLIFIYVAALRCSIGSSLAFCSINDVKFLVHPHIVKQGEEFFLEYQIEVNNGQIDERLQVGSFIRDEKAYYYFIGKTSFREFGNLVLRPLSQDKITEFAKKDSIYWLNSDGSKMKLEIDF